MFNPICYKSNLLCGTGRIAIVTGWTPKEKISKTLQPHEYGVIGQLYSPMLGIDAIIRNLLANPQITCVFILNATQEDKNSGSVDCLYDFFKNGVMPVDDYWLIMSEHLGQIKRDVKLDDLNDLRSKVYFAKADNLSVLFKIIKTENKFTQETTRTAKFYPIPEMQFTTKSGVLSGHLIRADTISAAWIKILQKIRLTGKVRPNLHGGQWQELLDMVVVVDSEPFDCYFPDPNFLPSDRNNLYNYVASFLYDNKSEVKYNYGQRMRSWFGVDQIKGVVDKLKDNPDSARAVINLWDVSEDASSDSPPCLNHIWVRIVGNKLHLTATLRSNDMFSAWVLNAMGLRILQQKIRNQINPHLELGDLVTISQSAHIYDSAWEYADRVVQEYYNGKPTFTDPVGNFIISWATDKIVVQQLTPEGKECDRFKGSNPLKLIREICRLNPDIQPDHAGYLGLELHKCSEETSNYIQDRKKPKIPLNQMPPCPKKYLTNH